MKSIPTLFTALAALVVFGAATAPGAEAATAHPTDVSKHCSRGMTHKNGHRDCGKHKGNMKNMTPKTGTAPTPGTPSATPAPGAGPNGS